MCSRHPNAEEWDRIVKNFPLLQSQLDSIRSAAKPAQRLTGQLQNPPNSVSCSSYQQLQQNYHVQQQQAQQSYQQQQQQQQQQPDYQQQQQQQQPDYQQQQQQQPDYQQQQQQQQPDYQQQQWVTAVDASSPTGECSGLVNCVSRFAFLEWC